MLWAVRLSAGSARCGNIAVKLASEASTLPLVLSFMLPSLLATLSQNCNQEFAALVANLCSASSQVLPPGQTGVKTPLSMRAVCG